MTHTEFYNIATYGNEHWGGNFTEKEIKANANEYFNDYKTSKENRALTYNLKVLVELLKEDKANGSNNEELDRWISELESVER